MDKEDEYYEITLEETLEDMYDLLMLFHLDDYVGSQETNFFIDDIVEAEKTIIEFETKHPNVSILYDKDLGSIYMAEIGEYRNERI